MATFNSSQILSAKHGADGRVRLLSLAGIPILIDLGWIILAVLITWTLWRPPLPGRSARAVRWGKVSDLGFPDAGPRGDPLRALTKKLAL